MKPLDIAGPNVIALATTLFQLVSAIIYDENIHELELVRDIGLVPALFSGFFAPDRSFKIIAENPISSAQGHGVERSVYVKGLNLRVSDGLRWTPTSGMYSRPKFFGLPDVRREGTIRAFSIDGAWAALYMVTLGVGPDPICPFLLLAATCKDRHWVADLSLEYIHALDPSAAKILAPWFEITPDMVFKFPNDAQHPGLRLAAEFLPVALTEFIKERAPELHRSLHCSLLCYFFFGHWDPYTHPEFIAFAKGFNIRLKGSRTFFSHCDDFKNILAAVYNRRIKSVDDVLQRVVFLTSEPAGPIADLQHQMFQLRFVRWLRGVGYPRSVRNAYVPIEEFKAQRHNPLIRAERFLYSVTEMLVIPLDEEFTLNIHLCRFLTNAAKPATNRPSLFFHDCTIEVAIPLNEWTDNILLEPAAFNDPQKETEFDRWMSSEFSLQGGDYNAL
ncbi:hypothetical protein DFH07DRAFT_786132 [Mycena maculata]|uniref:Uncharacterized protein n=1 Tax=Mycena maculata TaxID=230809 RepID=A0AAD7KFY9_9AGAR|nr:hypothetical protein DFH07DRAFT_786132 [Mycena maculata]